MGKSGRCIVVGALLAMAWMVSPARSQSNTPLKVGFVGRLSGNVAVIGTQVLTGLELHVDELNAAGGIQGRRIELVVYDSEAQPAAALQKMNKLVLQDQVALVIGALSSEALAVVDTVEKSQTPYLETYSRVDALTEGSRKYLWRLGSSYSSEARALSRLMKRWNASKPAILTDDSPTATGLLAALKKEMSAVSTQLVKPNADHADAEVKAMLSASPDSVLVALDVVSDRRLRIIKSQTNTLLKAVNDRVVVLNYGGAPDVVKRLGDEYPIGVWADSPDNDLWDNDCTGGNCSSSRPPHAAFIERLKKARPFASYADFPTYAVQGYVAMQVVAAACGKAGVCGQGTMGTMDRQKLAAAVPGLSVRTALGPLKVPEQSREIDRGVFFGRMIKNQQGILMDPGAIFSREPS
jgi:branched-chain amino acid transport system substrate-binding protein